MPSKAEVSEDDSDGGPSQIALAQAEADEALAQAEADEALAESEAYAQAQALARAKAEASKKVLSNDGMEITATSIDTINNPVAVPVAANSYVRK